MSDYVIETHSLSVYYGQQRGILDVDLQIEKGEVFGFLGPNGAGKTTTQRVLMDIIRPTEGNAFMFGKDCQNDGVAARQQVGYLPGELSLYENMKASQFFKMYFSLQKKVDSILKCNRMLKEYLKRSFEIKAFPWAMV